MNEQHELAKTQENLAQAWYTKYFNAHLFTLATKGKSAQYTNALTNEALAISGSPYFKLSLRTWSSAALDFLTQFA